MILANGMVYGPGRTRMEPGVQMIAIVVMLPPRHWSLTTPSRRKCGGVKAFLRCDLWTMFGTCRAYDFYYSLCTAPYHAYNQSPILWAERWRSPFKMSSAGVYANVPRHAETAKTSLAAQPSSPAEPFGLCLYETYYVLVSVSKYRTNLKS